MRHCKYHKECKTANIKVNIIVNQKTSRKKIWKSTQQDECNIRHEKSEKRYNLKKNNMEGRKVQKFWKERKYRSAVKNVLYTRKYRRERSTRNENEVHGRKGGKKKIQ